MTRLISRFRRLHAVTFLSLLTLAAATPIAGAAEPNKPATAPAAQADAAMTAVLDRKLPELRFDGVAFADVVDFLRDVTGSNVHVDWTGLEAAKIHRNTPLSYRGKDVRTGGVLKDLTALVGDADHPVSYAAAGGIIFISTPKRLERFVAAADALPGKSPDAASRAIIERVLPEIKFDGVGLADVIDFMRDVSGTTINIHWRELEAAGVDRNGPVTVHFKDMSFGQALNVILIDASAGKPLDFTAEEGRLLIRLAAPAAGPATKPAAP